MNPNDNEPIDLGRLRDITGIEKLPPPPPEKPFLDWPWISLIFLAGLGLIGWKLVRRRKLEKPCLSPREWALAELEKIEKMSLSSPKESEEIYTLLSNVIRGYLELRFRVPASQQTTPEFLITISESNFFDQPGQSLLRSFLERCDLAKFARARFSPQECRASTQMARDLVWQSTPVPAEQ
ncbi:MAG TPA: DUF4381 family protein [Gemmataceae bacterium]|jgi:hypothetical protein|nr:DUF4381 family protein [Gemmataceae bacterium]